MMTAEQAAAFAGAWYGAWNAHDLEAVMALYAPGIEHSSPFIARYTNDPTCAALRGKDAVRAYRLERARSGTHAAVRPFIGVGCPR
jgi:hypothetical protein